MAEVFSHMPHVMERLRDAEEQVIVVEARLSGNTGRIHEVHVSTVRDGRGRRLGRLLLFQDITAHKRLAMELARTRDELAERLRQLEAAQEEIVRRERLSVLGTTVATVSHEIRNPLGTVRNALHTLRELGAGTDEERARRALERAERAVRRCDAIITELLDFGRQRAPVMEDTEVDPWLAEVLADMEMPAGLHLRTALSSGARCRMDRERMRRAVLNVWENAVHAILDKGGEEALVTVTTAAAHGWVEISIEDSGPGMDAETLARVGEPLFSTKAYGVGLGVSVVKSVLQEHQGSVAIASAPGDGTTVVLRFPCLFPAPS